MRRATWIASVALHTAVIGVGATLAYGVAYSPGAPPLIRIQASDAALPARLSEPPREPVSVEDASPEPCVLPEPELVETREFFEDSLPPPEAVRPAVRPEWWRRIDPRVQVLPEADAGEADEAESVPDAADTDPVEPLTAPAAAFVPARRVADNPPPKYPPRARRLGHEGTVVVGVSLDAEGQVLGVELVRACAHRSLNREALETVRGWRFEPSTRDGVPEAGRIEIEVEFDLTNS